MKSCVDFRSYRLYEISPTGVQTIAKLISRATANRMIRSKTASEGIDRDGKTPCFLLTDTIQTSPVFWPARTSEPMLAEAERSSAAFSEPELMAIAGRKFKHGRSRTARMSDEQRQRRVDKRGKPLPAEDLVERATNKLQAWAEMGPALQELVREVAYAG